MTPVRPLNIHSSSSSVGHGGPVFSVPLLLSTGQPTQGRSVLPLQPKRADHRRSTNRSMPENQRTVLCRSSCQFEATAGPWRGLRIICMHLSINRIGWSEYPRCAGLPRMASAEIDILILCPQTLGPEQEN